MIKEPWIKSFSRTSLRGNPGGVTKQSLQLKLNPNGLLRRPSGTPRNDNIIGYFNNFTDKVF